MKWKTMDWVDARYAVSDTGSIKSWASNSGGWRKRPRLLVLSLDVDGYAHIELVTASGAKRFAVHRLVLQAFTGTVGPQANHKNGVRDDNRIKNLEWCTCSENVLHAFRVLGKKHPRPNAGRLGAANWSSKKVLQTTLSGTTVRMWDSAACAGRAGYSPSMISNVCCGKYPQHRGFNWQFV
jgi:hypothetical protein